MTQDKRREFPQWLAFVLAMLINSFTIVIITKADLGVSSLSSVAIILSEIFPQLSFGTWNILFQVSLMVSLIVFIKKKPIDAIISMLITVVFGLLLDFFRGLTVGWPVDLWARILYFTFGFFSLSLGASFFVKCDFPILPLDSFVKDIAVYLKKEYSKVKTFLDITFVTTTIILSLLVFGKIRLIGIGTILFALFMGNTMGIILRIMDVNLVFTKIGRN